MEIGVRVDGTFDSIFSFLNRIKEKRYEKILNEFGKIGVEALSAATPKDSGVTADSWEYRIENESDTIHVIWTNTNRTANGDYCVALLLQYGHGTGTGGYVQGRDYINPAMRPVFDNMAEAAWRVITSS